MWSTIVSLSLLAVQPASGFFPHRWVEQAFGEGEVSHAEMTEQVFEERAKAYFPQIRTLTSKMTKAMDEIAEANALVDKNQVSAHWHCDGESFPESKKRIAVLKGEVILALNGDNAVTARKRIGSALHTIQDFYSHSNWVELGMTDINYDLIRDVDMAPYTAKFSDPTCQRCETATNDAVCRIFNCDNNVLGRLLTSGYYYGEDTPANGIEIPNHKCRHGGYLDSPPLAGGGLYGFPNQGINKDSLHCGWSPHWKSHHQAVKLAKAASKQYIDDIKALISPASLRKLFGVGPTLAFAIDTTGSMHTVISYVKSISTNIVKSRVGTVDEPSNYILSPFKDPGVGPLIVTSSTDTFIAEIAKIYADAGGDCPEMSISGMLAAANAMDDGDTLFVFTDAAPKDGHLEAELLTTSTKKKLTIHIFKYDSSSCDDGKAGLLPPTEQTQKLQPRKDSVSDRVYPRICAATGGQCFKGHVNDVLLLKDIMDTLIASDISAILRVEDKLTTNNTKKYSVPVDSYMTKLSRSVTGASASMSVTQPDSSPLGTANVTRTQLGESQFISIKTPMAGSYTVSINGTGNFTLSAQGTSTIRLSRFNFAYLGGRLGHSGWYPIRGPPPYNQKIAAMADMAGQVATTTFSFRQASYEHIGDITLNPGSGEEGFPSQNSWFNIVQTPDKPFFVYVSGTDDKGAAYQRVMEAITMPIFANTPFPLKSNYTIDPDRFPSTTTSTTVIATSSSYSTTSSTSTTRSKTCRPRPKPTSSLL